MHNRIDSSTEPCVAIRLGRMGDALLATGVLEHWRKTRNLSFSFVVKAELAEIFRGHPAVRSIVAVDKPDLRNAAWLRFCRKLAAESRGRMLLDLHGNLRSRILAACWSGPIRRYPKFGLERRILQRFQVPALARKLNALSTPQRYAMALDETPPAPQDVAPLLLLDDAELARADQYLSETGGTGPFVALHPYAAHANKAWPEEHWRSLARMLLGQGLCPVVIGRDPNPLSIQGALDLTSRTGLRQTAAVLARCRALVTGDSGPMHLARAVTTPVTALFGPTVRAWGFFPDGPSDTVLERGMACRPCSLHGARPCPRNRRCLADIAPSEALQSVLAVLDHHSPERA
jgi:ADP-heptose:LPS heptosyltransferase